MKKRMICMLIIAVSTMMLFGCGKEKSAVDGDIVTIKYWQTLNPQLTTVAKNIGETPYAKKMQEILGVNIEFIHPNSDEQFNLMLASGDLPDIVEHAWLFYGGGPEKAMSDKYIINLNEIFENNAPNLKKYLNENPEIDTMIKTDNGNYYAFPFIRGDEKLLVSTGPIVRKDWLSELSLSVPETMEDWYNMLTLFKEKKGANMPLTFMPYDNAFRSGLFTGAYGVAKDFYIGDDGKVKFGAIEPGYKEFIIEMRKWYKEGLLDNNFMSIDAKAVDSSMLNGTAGATFGALGGGIGKYLGEKTNEDYDLIGTPYPVLKKGDIPMLSTRQNPYPGLGAAISSKSKNADIAAKVLDFAYSEEGHLLNNFGIENESYTLQNGKPVYTELITKNPDGISMAGMMAQYLRANYMGAFVQDVGYIEQYASLPQQQAALDMWTNTTAEKHKLPAITHSEEDSAELATIMSDIYTYENEGFLNFIIGATDLSKLDEYVSKMNEMGIQRAIDIYQRSLDKYNTRGQ